MPLADRGYYLAQALTSAKSAASLGAEDVELVSNLQERMEVASVQMEVMRGIEAHPEMSKQEKDEMLHRLNTGLVNLDDVCSFASLFKPSTNEELVVSKLCSTFQIVRMYSPYP